MKNVMLFVLLTLTSPAFSQSPPQGPGGPGSPGFDVIGTNLFNPDLIMNHQTELGLSESQKESLIKEMQTGQGGMIGPSFKVKSAMEELNSVLSKPRVDESKAIAALQNLTKHEDEVKVHMVRMLVRMKNILTPQQQEKLRGLK
jgi:Spy/CpxP family protein refolding chaperone